MYPFSRLLRLHHRLSRRFTSLPNPNPKPSPSPSITSTLKSLFREHDPTKLAADVKRLSDSPLFRSKIGVYVIAVNRLFAAGHHDAIADILDNLKRYPTDFTREVPISRLISLYGRAGLLDRAIAAFYDLPGPRTVLSFNSLLSACARANDTDRLATLFREIPSDNPSIVPNTATYSILIDSLCENNQLDAALDTIHLMEKNDPIPDLVTFNTLLKGFYGSGRFAEGDRIWVQMLDIGIKPDIITYNTKLKAIVSEEKVSEAEELVRELKATGVKPNIYTYNELIRGYCQCGDWRKCMKVLKEMGRDACVPIRWTYEIVITVLHKAGQLNLALKLCKQCIHQRCYVDPRVLQEVVDELAVKGRLEEAEKLVEYEKLRTHFRDNLKAPLPSGNSKTPLSSLFMNIFGDRSICNSHYRQTS